MIPCLNYHYERKNIKCMYTTLLKSNGILFRTTLYISCTGGGNVSDRAQKGEWNGGKVWWGMTVCYKYSVSIVITFGQLGCSARSVRLSVVYVGQTDGTKGKSNVDDRCYWTCSFTKALCSPPLLNRRQWRI